MDTNDNPEAPQDIQVQIPPEVQRGTYANQLVVAHSPEEFILDFIFVTPPAGVVNSRVVISPAHAKRMVAALQENIIRYEATFGEIKVNPLSAVPETKIKTH